MRMYRAMKAVSNETEALHKAKQALAHEAAVLKKSTENTLKSTEETFKDLESTVFKEISPEIATEEGFIGDDNRPAPVATAPSPAPIALSGLGGQVNNVFPRDTIIQPVQPVDMPQPTPVKASMPSEFVSLDKLSSDSPISSLSNEADQDLDTPEVPPRVISTPSSQVSTHQSQSAYEGVNTIKRPFTGFSSRRWATLVLTIAILGGGILLVSFHSNGGQGTPQSQGSLSAQNISAIANSPLQTEMNSGTIHINRNTLIAVGKSLTTTGTVTLQNSKGGTLLLANPQNDKVGINTVPTGTASLQVGGDIQASGELAANSGATSVSNNGLKINNVVVCTAAGCNSISSSQLPANTTLQGNTFNGAGQLVQLTASGILPALSAANLFNVNATTLQGNIASYFTNASHLSSGTLSNSRLSANVTLQGNTFNGASQLVQLNPSGDLPALSGVNLTNLNASNIAAGTLNDARLSTNVTVQGNTFNGASQLLQLTAMDYYPALNGSLITNLNASNVASGTLNDSRLSTNVALLGAIQTFTGTNTFSNLLTAPALQSAGATLAVGTSSSTLQLQGDISSTFVMTNSGHSVTLGFSGTPSGNVTYNFDDAATSGTYTICSTIGNCAGTGGGVTTLGGTTNKIAKFTGAASIGDSSISDTGTTVTVQPLANSTNSFQIQNVAGTSNLLIADTTNTRIAIGQASATYTLDVAGDINSTTGLRVGGTLVCNSSGCIAASSSGFYIQNGTSLQTTANFNIQSVNSANVGGIIRGATGQTADLLQLKDGTDAVVTAFSAGGNLNIAGTYSVNGSQISSANLSNNANLAKLDGTGPQIFTGNNKFTGTFLAQNAVNSTTAFQIQNAAGTDNLFIADTINGRIGIGMAPGYTLDIAGDINISSGSYFRMNGVAICGAGTCAPSAGSNNYIQNTVALQSGANFNIQSVNSASVVGILRGATGQSADLFRAQDENGANVFTVGATGDTAITPSANSTTALRVQNATGNEVLRVDTSGNHVALGKASTLSADMVFYNAGGSGSTTLQGTNPGASTYTITIPAETGTI